MSMHEIGYHQGRMAVCEELIEKPDRIRDRIDELVQESVLLGQGGS
jgi:hypothetical protein